MVRDSVAKRGGLVWESRMWLEILEAKAIDIYIGKSLVSVTQTNGVRQGSPDSAVLYSASIGETLQDLHDNVPLGEAGRADLAKCPSQGAGYMDDTYLWSENAKAMQRAITYLEGKLGKKGNVVNVVKTQILCSEPDDTEFRVGGQKVKAGGATDIMNALGSPLTFEKSGARLPCAPQTALRENSAREPHENADHLGQKLCDCATWPNNAALLRAANACQLGCVRAMIGTKRGATESWAEWQVRTMRMARVALFNSRQERWFTYALRQMWKLHGHAARHPGPTKDLLLWRNLKWWKEVAEPAGCKHGGRFNSSVDIERSISRIGGYDWVDLAQDRDQWQALQESFVEEFDLPWASGRQPAIANLTQIRSFTPKSRPKPTAALTDSVVSGRMTPGIPAGASASDSQSSSASAKS
ncbi:pol [Symbiodinium sp. CCMP2592]|nr:pol [Symbiodinium sp. CCMP2592]